jgi:glycogen phosphorylase
VKNVMNSLIDGTFSKDKTQFQLIYDEIMNRGDEFMVLGDFRSYLEASKKMEMFYTDRLSWGQKCLTNVAYSGWFSSDRTIGEYNSDIWHLEKIH